MLNSTTAIKKYLKQFQKIDLLPQICRNCVWIYHN